MKKCVFAGTFDPFTAGHAETVKKCLALFDEVIVAAAENRKKKCLFSAEERTQMLELLYRGEPRVKIVRFDGAIVDLLKAENPPFYVRGVRNTVDFEYENADFFASRQLDPSMITLYIPAEQSLLHVSSSLVKNCIAFNKPFAQYVPEPIYDYITKRGCYVSKTE